MERISYQDVSKGLIKSMTGVNTYLESTSLDPILKELIKLRASQINGCAYCIDMHYKEALYEGETALRLYSLTAWREAPFYTEKEKAVLAFTEAVTLISENDLEENVYEPLTQFFSKKEIADITLAISQINSWNRLMKTFKITPGMYEVSKS